MECLRDAVNSNIIDAIATDHAPHELSEKKDPTLKLQMAFIYSICAEIIVRTSS